ncbi:MAG TPA: hypothetical protein PK765_05895 [bacterium]|nr:hypothetical protein [bacterium]
MFRHLLVLVVLSWVLVPHANAQESAVSDPIEYGVESADSVTFEFDARASADRIEMGESFTLEVSIVQK